MSDSMSEFKEPYPIYRALRVPLWECGKLTKVRRVTDIDRREFEEVIKNKLRPMLERLLKLAETVKAGKGGRLSDDERLELIADAIVIFLRAPLIQEISPVAPTPLKAHTILLLPKEVAEKDYWSDDIFEFAKKLVEEKAETQTIDIFDAARELFQPDTAEKLFRLWVAFPADTRPGHNTSSLIVHSLMTSAIAWALSYGLSKEDIATIRLVALLHDLGKVRDPQKHFQASRDLAEQLLGGLVSRETLNRLLDAIERHHLQRDSIIKEADRLAAAADRVNKLVEMALGDKISRIKEVLRLEKTERDWEFWTAVYERRDELKRAGLFCEDPIRELTEEFLSKVDELVGSEGYRKEPPKSDSRIKLVFIDIASIQEYVLRGHEIRVVAAASHLIELAVHAHFFWFLRQKVSQRHEVSLPPEAVIYSGGGNVLLLVPSNIVEDVEDAAKEYGKKLGLKLVTAPIDFVDDYVIATERIAKILHERKHKVTKEMLPDQVHYDCGQKNGGASDKLCEICYNAWATEPLPEGERQVCALCRKLYDLGSEQHFAVKWRSRIMLGGQEFSSEEVFGRKWREVSKWVMEIIAGHDPEELEDGVKRYRDYAVLKFDVNAFGRFMLESVSFTDAVERSFRVDVAMKRAYVKALEALYNGVKAAKDERAAKKEVIRVYLGTIYMGGDDGFLLVPSWASVPFAHVMAEEFSRQLGLERGIKVAVAAGPAMMSVWSLLDCAQEMMSLSKQVLRREDPTVRDKVLGSIAFDLYETGSPSGATARDRLERISIRIGTEGHQDEEIDSLQPYLIRRSDLEGSTVPEFWEGVGRLVLRMKVPDKWGGCDHVWSFYVDAFRQAYCIAAQVDNMDDWVKSVRDAILRSWPQVSPSKYWREKLIVYFLRQEERGEKELRGAYEDLAELGMLTVLSGRYGYGSRRSALSASLGPTGSQDGIGPFPLADVLTLVKLAKGGAW